MNYDQLVDALFSYPGRALKRRTLEPMLELDVRLNHPHRSFKCIHVAGTNGKGSVSHKIAKALTAAGYKTGLYTSPHIETFEERMQIDGECIPQKAVLSLLPNILEIAGGKASFFELLTALAFVYFHQEQVDYAVIEAGLGGRLDATNIIIPVLSIITSISRDHTRILGETLDEIAREKAGIVKLNVSLILGPHANLPLLTKLPQSILIDSNSPFYDEENSAIAARALQELKISPEYIEKGIASRPPCRFEIIKKGSKTYIFDVAHNPSGFEKLLSALDHHFPDQKARFICSFSKDKEIDACLKLILDNGHEVSWLDYDHPRLASSSGKDTVQPKDIEQLANSLVVVCGSFFIMSAVKCNLK